MEKMNLYNTNDRREYKRRAEMARRGTRAGVDVRLGLRVYSELVRRGFSAGDAREAVYLAARDGLLGYYCGR